jgi:hypothetical protein
MILAQGAHAACGSAFCPLSTDWDVRGVWTEPGGRAELRFEYIDQDQPRAGRHKTGPEAFTGDHVERRTINRNWVGTLDYNFSPQWGVSLGIPLVERSHEHIHIHEDEGEQELQTWNFTELGDIRAVARYTIPAPPGAMTSGMSLGLKLPTGSFKERNDAGELAERSLQPGTGTTDAIAGVFFTGTGPGPNATWFADATGTFALNTRDDYRPGVRLGVNGGVRYSFTREWAGLLQLNFLYKDHDKGQAAEPADSGGTFWFLNPGVSWLATPGLQVFAYVQLPLYQRVNGVQLTADWAGVLGVAARF